MTSGGLWSWLAFCCAWRRWCWRRSAPACRAAGARGTRHCGPATDACKRAAFRLVIDVGHTAEAPGAKSARGVYRISYSTWRSPSSIEQELIAAGFRGRCCSSPKVKTRKGLDRAGRPRQQALGADLLLSIHHDSVPDKFLEKWEFEGEERSFSDRFNGHSIFVSQDNNDRAGSLLFARLLGNQLRDRGLQYTPHYTERIMGNRQRLLVDARAGSTATIS